MDTVKANSDIYSVKANSQAGNIRAYMVTTQKGQSCKTLSKGLKKNYVFCQKTQWGPWVQDRALLGLRICLWEYIWKANFEIYFPPQICCDLLSGLRKGSFGA